MSERFNKNGIRILDPEKQTNHIVNPRCLPGEHRWKEMGFVPGSLDIVLLKCVRCGDTMEEDELDVDGLIRRY